MSGAVRTEALPQTLMTTLAQNAQAGLKRPGFREREFGIWREWSWSEVLEEVLSLAAGLEELGLGPGRALTVVGDNRAVLYFAMLSATALRGFASPVYPDVPVTELDAYLRFGTPDIALAEDQEQVDKLLDLRGRIGRPSVILYDDPRGVSSYSEPGLLALSAVMERGAARLAAEPGLREDLIGRAQPEDPAVILYSSGTTGKPKGIPLSHRNILSGVRNAEKGGYFRKGEVLFAWLPTAWVGDYVFTLGAGVALQATINIPERQETALHDMREVAPSFYLAAPRAWDAMLTRIHVGMADSTPMKRRLYDWFIPRAIELERKRLSGYSPGLAERFREGLGQILVYGPLKDYLGLSRAERAFTGGEAMGEETFLFFRALGIRLKQFYGQTETCALTAAQVEGSVRIDTVGRAMPGVEVRIDESGEILIRSDAVFAGYADNPEATAEALTPEGFLRTGDAGRLDEKGDLTVLGRVSELVATAAGERFIPTFIENRMKFSPYIRNVAVIGAGRPELTAIVCIDYEAVGHWAEQRAISYSGYAGLSQEPAVLDLIAGEIARVNALQPEGLRIARFVNLHKDFDADDGEITRTRKLRRKTIEANYAPLVEALYDGSQSVSFEARIAYEDGRSGVLRRDLEIRRL